MTRVAAIAGVAAGALAYWWARTHPEPLPYSQRFLVDIPHPLLSRSRLREVLAPKAGERVLEVGPGTGYYTLELADWVSPGGAVELLDVRQEWLDHTLRRARERGLENVSATRADAQGMPYDEGSFDAAVLVTVLGEVSEQDAAVRELHRVLTPGGRLVVGEMVADPHFVPEAALRRRGEAAGLRFERRAGPALAYFARLVKP